MAETGQDLFQAAEWLRKGELVAIPTETVYGLAANAFDAIAVSKIFAVKNRPSFNPLILHTSKIERVYQFVQHIPDKLKALAEKFWPGPLTLLLQKKEVVPDLVTAGLPTVAVRIPGHPLTLQLLDSLQFPLAAPSANPFKYISPTTPLHVDQQLGDKIPYILDGGPCKVGIESTIVGVEQNEIVVYRLGGIDLESLQASLNENFRIKPISSSQPSSPGMLRQHYSPNKKIIIGDPRELIKSHPALEVGILAFKNKVEGVKAEHQVILSSDGNLAEAATALFAALRHLDKLPITVIFAELLPEHGLGRAINDRLKRASAI